MKMKEVEFWNAIVPYLEREGVITIANLQLALGLSKERADEVAALFCSEKKLFRVVTRDSWGYIRIDPEDEIPQLPRCGRGAFRSKPPTP